MRARTAGADRPAALVPVRRPATVALLWRPVTSRRTGGQACPCRIRAAPACPLRAVTTIRAVAIKAVTAVRTIIAIQALRATTAVRPVRADAVRSVRAGSGQPPSVGRARFRPATVAGHRGPDGIALRGQRRWVLRAFGPRVSSGPGAVLARRVMIGRIATGAAADRVWRKLEADLGARPGRLVAESAAAAPGVLSWLASLIRPRVSQPGIGKWRLVVVLRPTCTHETRFP